MGSSGRKKSARKMAELVRGLGGVGKGGKVKKHAILTKLQVKKGGGSFELGRYE